MLTRMPLVAFLLAALSGCAADDPPPATPPVPPSLLVGCQAPQDLPARALTGAEIEVFWGRDRSALRECGSRHSGLSHHVNQVDTN